MPKNPEQYTPPEAEGKISLRHLLTYDNPKMSEYQELIDFVMREGAGPDLPQEYSSAWGDILTRWGSVTFVQGSKIPEYNPPEYERVRAYFKEKLPGQILVDVGGGALNQIMRSLAKKFGVKTYVNVDLTYDGRLDPYTAKCDKSPANYFWRLPPEERTKPMDEYLVTADMLDFVARLPNNSCNFALNGIELDVLSPSIPSRGIGYSQALFAEMVRATKIGGTIFGVESNMWAKGDQRLSENLAEGLGLETEQWGRQFRVFEKIKE